MTNYVRSASKATIASFMFVGCNRVMVAELTITPLKTIEV